MKSTYIYARTRLSLSNAWGDSIDWFVKSFPESHVKSFQEIRGNRCLTVNSIEVFNFGLRTWANGFVIRFEPVNSLREFIGYARPSLEKFDAWCIANEQGEYLEAPIDATFGSFFSRAKGHGRAQIFLRDESVDATEELLYRLKEDLRADSAPVLHFDDGKIIFLCCNEPAGIIEQRYKHIFRRIGSYIIIDAFGYCVKSDAVAGITLKELAKALAPPSAVRGGSAGDIRAGLPEAVFRKSTPAVKVEAARRIGPKVLSRSKRASTGGRSKLRQSRPIPRQADASSSST